MPLIAGQSGVRRGIPESRLETFIVEVELTPEGEYELTEPDLRIRVRSEVQRVVRGASEDLTRWRMAWDPASALS